MKKVHYKHASGLIFTTERLVSYDEKSSHDISVVCLWLPNSAQDPMVLVDWYCGEPDENATALAAEAYLSKLFPTSIQNLLECQDAPPEGW
jgi:hypothetical protein